MFTDEYFMKMALQEAETALEKDEVPVGCIIVSNDRVIARSHNLMETLTDVTAHAEMQAITSAANFLGGKYLQNCTLYVTLEPCQMCSGAIVQARVKRVVIGCMNPKAGCAGSILNLLQVERFNHQVEITSGVLEAECSQMMKGFFKELREKQKKDMTCCYKNEAKKKTPFQAATTSHPQDTSVQVMSH